MEPEGEIQPAEVVTARTVARQPLAQTSDLRVTSVGTATADAYERHAPEVHGFLVRVTRDQETAADLCAEAFTRLLVEERAGRWPLQPRAWLFRVASNLAMSRGRRLRVAGRVERAMQRSFRDRTDETPDVEVLRRELNDDLQRALAALPRDARLALLLAAQGFDGVAIAAMIGRTHAATRTLMSRSRTRLRDILREGAA